MENLQRTLNEYLFHECGIEGDASLISEAWPFALRAIGQVQSVAVFEFDDGEPFFALAGESLNFTPKAGMAIDDLQLQYSGASWISAHNPVDLSTSMPGDASVPSGLERRRALEALGGQGGVEAEILEGLFLRIDRRYLGLFRAHGEECGFVAGLSPSPIPVSFPRASAWRRLAWGVGTWLRRGGGG